MCTPDGSCTLFVKRVYFHHATHSCFGGCEGDCQRQQPDVLCYMEFPCSVPGIELSALCGQGGGIFACMPVPQQYFTCQECEWNPLDEGTVFWHSDWRCQ
jgi:hypothetical protein